VVGFVEESENIYSYLEAELYPSLIVITKAARRGILMLMFTTIT
jgi:hypothetical protein